MRCVSPAQFRYVGGARVAHCDRRIVLKQQIGYGDTHDVAAADDNSVFA